MHQVLDEIGKIGLVPVVKIDDENKAAPLAKALCEGGLPVAEVTFRTPQAEESMRRISAELPEMIVGAGTVLTTEQVDRAVGAGAKFIVSPGFNRRIVEYCVKKGIPVTPGCSSASDIEQALECGLEVVKFFPAEPAGGLPMIKSLCGPYHSLMFMPTGGVNARNLNDYLAYPKILACGGSWMVQEESVARGDFDAVVKLTREAVQTMLGFEIGHIGINADPGSAGDIARVFTDSFGFPGRDTPVSVFAGDAIEVMKTPKYGAKGHIAIRTNTVERAVYHLARKGVKFDADSEKRDEKGALTFVYLKDEIGGFAVHLIQK